jgi:hypothetical protein
LRNFAGPENDEDDDQDEEQFHPAERTEHQEISLSSVSPPDTANATLRNPKGGDLRQIGWEAIEIREISQV